MNRSFFHLVKNYSSLPDTMLTKHQFLFTAQLCLLTDLPSLFPYRLFHLSPFIVFGSFLSDFSKEYAINIIFGIKICNIKTNFNIFKMSQV